ncbi:hypothetical protein [Kribbella amoyensis]|uniref:hypothetical protein n=1 Tax=Kribbella amoyensis TaxID=996641 RepID=UPI0014782DF6|nr:hypothetical protein [Kribbella amoyensis]
MDDRLRDWIRADFGLNVAEITSVGHGADIAAQVWEAVAAEGRYAVKWSAAGSDTGHEVAAFLADSGVAGIPQLVRTVAGGCGATTRASGSP